MIDLSLKTMFRKTRLSIYVQYYYLHAFIITGYNLFHDSELVVS